MASNQLQVSGTLAQLKQDVEAATQALCCCSPAADAIGQQQQRALQAGPEALSAVGSGGTRLSQALASCAQLAEGVREPAHEAETAAEMAGLSRLQAARYNRLP